MKTVLTVAALAATLAAAGCTPPAPPTLEQQCAMMVGKQTGIAADSITTKGTVATSVGPKIYVVANGTTYSCQGDKNGNLASPQLQG